MRGWDNGGVSLKEGRKKNRQVRGERDAWPPACEDSSEDSLFSAAFLHGSWRQCSVPPSTRQHTRFGRFRRALCQRRPLLNHPTDATTTALPTEPPVSVWLWTLDQPAPLLLRHCRHSGEAYEVRAGLVGCGRDSSSSQTTMAAALTKISLGITIIAIRKGPLCRPEPNYCCSGCVCQRSSRLGSARRQKADLEWLYCQLRHSSTIQLLISSHTHPTLLPPPLSLVGPPRSIDGWSLLVPC